MTKTLNKQKYLEKLSKMNGGELVEELLFRDYLLEQERNSIDEYTQRYFKLEEMFNTCSNYIAERLNK